MYKEAQRANVQNNGVDGQFPVSEQVRVIAPEVVRPELIKRFIDVLLEVLDRLQIRMNRRCSVVAADEFLPHSLNECCHRDLLSL